MIGMPGPRQSEHDALRARALDELRRRMSVGDLLGAVAMHAEVETSTGAWDLDAADRDRLIEALWTGGHQAAAQPLLEYAARETGLRADRQRLRLAALILDRDPRRALAMLLEVDPSSLDPDSRQWRTKVIAQARGHAQTPAYPTPRPASGNLPVAMAPPPPQPPTPTPRPTERHIRIDARGLPVLDDVHVPPAPAPRANTSPADELMSLGRWREAKAVLERTIGMGGDDADRARLRLARILVTVDHLPSRALRLLNEVAIDKLSPADIADRDLLIAEARRQIGGSTGRHGR
jgi:hypothetical protein